MPFQSEYFLKYANSIGSEGLTSNIKTFDIICEGPLNIFQHFCNIYHINDDAKNKYIEQI